LVKNEDSKNIIAFQGVPEQIQIWPAARLSLYGYLAVPSFDDVFQAVEDGKADARDDTRLETVRRVGRNPQPAATGFISLANISRRFTPIAAPKAATLETVKMVLFASARLDAMQREYKKIKLDPFRILTRGGGKRCCDHIERARQKNERVLSFNNKIWQS